MKYREGAETEDESEALSECCFNTSRIDGSDTASATSPYSFRNVTNFNGTTPDTAHYTDNSFGRRWECSRPTDFFNRSQSTGFRSGRFSNRSQFPPTQFNKSNTKSSGSGFINTTKQFGVCSSINSGKFDKYDPISSISQSIFSRGYPPDYGKLPIVQQTLDPPTNKNHIYPHHDYISTNYIRGQKDIDGQISRKNKHTDNYR